MKKLSILCMLLIFSIYVTVGYCSVTSFFVSRIMPSSTQVSTAATLTMPALVKGVTSTATQFSHWIPIAVSIAAQSSIFGAVVGVSSAMALYYVYNRASEWFASRGINSSMQSVSTVTVPDGYTQADFLGGIEDTPCVPGSACVSDGLFKDSTAAYDAMNAYRTANGLGSTGAIYTTFRGARGYYVYNPNYNPMHKHHFWYPFVGPYHNETVTVPYDTSMLRGALENDLNAGGTAMDKAKVASTAALEAAASALDNPAHDLNSSSAMPVIKTALNGAVTQGQKDALEGVSAAPVTTPQADTAAAAPGLTSEAVRAALAAQGLSASQIAAAIAAVSSSGGLTEAQTAAAVATALSGAGLSGANLQAGTAAALTAAGLSAAGVKTAVKDALDDETGVSSPVDPTIITPDKLSLTGILNSFYNAIANMPIIQTVQGINLQLSGATSNICLPNFISNSDVCYDMSANADVLNALGTGLLTLTTIASVIGVFRS